MNSYPPGTPSTTTPEAQAQAVHGRTPLAERARIALELACHYGQIDGAHHKDWVIDHMVRALTGPQYAAWVAEYEEGGKYTWDTGIAP